jgi:hypothetical protein
VCVYVCVVVSLRDPCLERRHDTAACQAHEKKHKQNLQLLVCISLLHLFNCALHAYMICHVCSSEYKHAEMNICTYMGTYMHTECM